MVSEASGRSGLKVKADIIILGCSLPGIVTAHKLKRKFGNTVDIVVLDLERPAKKIIKGKVAFNEEDEDIDEITYDYSTARQLIDNVARCYIVQYAKEFNVPLPEGIITPERVGSNLYKLFQYSNGSKVECTGDYHDFDYLRFVERFEINQYQTLLDRSMKDLFQTNEVNSAEKTRLLYYDRTTMEQHICGALLFTTSREIMRTTVRLVCGAPADTVSVLFYLHQCYRTSSSRNHLDGRNTRFREKLLGYCRKRLAMKLQNSVADIILQTKCIKKIRTHAKEQVILETMKGGTSYVCNLLAMALRPDELNSIHFDDKLLSKKQVDVATAMTPGRAKKFVVTYECYFWRDLGYSGDILSIQGPIIWAIESPSLSFHSNRDNAALVGYLMIREDVEDSREAVLEQLVHLFGELAASPISYNETNISDVFIPRCGDYVAVRRLILMDEGTPQALIWGALDMFADGDVAAALEAGHTAYLHLLRCLRPQAETFEDVAVAEWPTILSDGPLEKWLSYVNFMNSVRCAIYSAALFMGIRLLRSYMKRD